MGILMHLRKLPASPKSLLLLEAPAFFRVAFGVIVTATIAALGITAQANPEALNAVRHLIYLPVFLTAVYLGAVPSVLLAVFTCLFFSFLELPDLSWSSEDWVIQSIVITACAGITGLAVQILKRYAKRLNDSAYTDPITQVRNRIAMQNEIQKRLQYHSGKKLSFHVLVLNLNTYTDIARSLGHQYGDFFLIEAVRILHSVLPGDVCLGRLYGDKFCVLLDTDRQAVIAMIEELVQKFKAPFTISDIPLYSDLHTGISKVPDNGIDPISLVQKADLAMQFSMDSGKPYHFYTSATEQRNHERLSILGDLYNALSTDQLQLYYQPKHSLTTNEVTGAEALLRWFHPEKGLIPPNSFIRVAEPTALIHSLTEFVIETALRQIAAWQKKGLKVPVAVNISARNLTDTGFPELVARILELHSVEPALLELEVTETFLLSETPETRNVLQALYDTGIRISMDDFGTGYSSLSFLEKLPIGLIKIDRSFVQNLLVKKHDEEIVRAAIAIAKNMGISSLAEGVEESAVAERLHQLGCDYAQGYLYAKPLPANEFEEYLRSH
jgi:diguanylate cyclase (GGDEF)-like protein